MKYEHNDHGTIEPGDILHLVESPTASHDCDRLGNQFKVFETDRYYIHFKDNKGTIGFFYNVGYAENFCKNKRGHKFQRAIGSNGLPAHIPECVFCGLQAMCGLCNWVPRKETT